MGRRTAGGTGWSRRQRTIRPLVRAARPSSSRPSCRSKMFLTTGRAGPLPVHVSGMRARSTSRRQWLMARRLLCSWRTSRCCHAHRLVTTGTPNPVHALALAPLRSVCPVCTAHCVRRKTGRECACRCARAWRRAAARAGGQRPRCAASRIAARPIAARFQNQHAVWSVRG